MALRDIIDLFDVKVRLERPDGTHRMVKAKVELSGEAEGTLDNPVNVGRVFLATKEAPSLNDTMLLPYPYPRNPAIRRIEPIVDEGKVDHFVVYFSQ